ncbi:MAG: right-handed parallel beta-helix repeat-containing protein [Deltaproteobacteria bacterium]|nr:right-handed parallel beta-helix repeat-containing protein [Deltaproteobacteria bacterium]
MRGWAIWLLGAAVGAPTSAWAADWYVAPGGVNGGAGSEASPLATVEHAVSRASAGDTIHLQRGGEYPVVGLTVSGMELAAYGAGPAPILTASTQVSLPDTWGMNANVRTGPVTEEVLAVYVDGRFVRRARYPNTGFLRIDNDDDPDTIVDAELADRPGVAAGRWTGAQVRWRRWSWWWETRPITDHSDPTTLHLGPDGRFNDPFSDPGSGYFIDGDLDELDAPGEWHWEAGTLYLYPPAGADPGTMRVDVVTTSDPGIRSRNATLRDLHFTRYVGGAVEINRPTTIDGCEFSELETDGVRFTYDAQPFVVTRSIFRDVRNVAITGAANDAGTPGSRIERNLFLRIGVERGYGGSGSWHAAGVIIARAAGVEFTLNRVVDTGYAGVILGSAGQRVYRNVFVRTMGTLNDGGAVYTNCNASDIRENIILDTLGDLETSHPWWPLGHGIWPEFLGAYRDTQIVGNTIFGSNGRGIFLPNNYNCTVDGNISVGDRRSGLDLSGNDGEEQGHTITNNTFVTLAGTGGRLERPENLSHWWLPPYAAPAPVGVEYESTLSYGTMRATTFVTSPSDAHMARGSGTEFDDVAAWASAASWADATDTRLLQAQAALVLFNDTEATASVPVPAGTWRLTDGSAAGAAVQLAPFAGAVLLTDEAYTGPPYLSASGIDWRLAEPATTYLTAEPELVVVRDGQTISVGGVDDVGDTPLTGLSLGYTVRNEGGAVLGLGVAHVMDATNCNPSVTTLLPDEVAPASSAPLALTVETPSEGAWSFTISFTTTDADESPAVWTVQGQAKSDAVPDAGVVVDAGPDAGHPADSGVASPDAGAEVDAGGMSGDGPSGGCGCRGAGSPGAAGLWLMMALGMVLARRRR